MCLIYLFSDKDEFADSLSEFIEPMAEELLLRDIPSSIAVTDQFEATQQKCI